MNNARVTFSMRLDPELVARIDAQKIKSRHGAMIQLLEIGLAHVEDHAAIRRRFALEVFAAIDGIGPKLKARIARALEIDNNVV